MLYKLSENFRCLVQGSEFVVFNSLNAGSLRVVDENALKFLLGFKEIKDIQKEITASDNPKETEEAVRDFCDAKLLVEGCFDERFYLKKCYQEHLLALKSGAKLEGLVLEITKKCNLHCVYCFSSQLIGSVHRPSMLDMSLETASLAINKLITLASSHRHDSIGIAFMGGEPLLRWGFIKQIIQQTVERLEVENIKAVFSITTNGTLVTPVMAEELKSCNIRVSVSLDGPEDLHNSARPYGNGRGSYRDVLRGIRCLSEAKNDVTVLTTLTNNNLDSIGDSFIQAIVSAGVKHWGVNVEDMGSLLTVDSSKVIDNILSLAEKAYSSGIDVGGMWLKPIFAMIGKKQSYCGSSEGAYVSVEVDGSIYSCSRSRNAIGDVNHFDDLCSSPGYISWGSSIVGTKIGCVGCDFEAHCLGGCPAVNDGSNEQSSCSLTGCGKCGCLFIKEVTNRILANPDSPFFY